MVFCCKFCDIFKNTFFAEHFWWLLLTQSLWCEDSIAWTCNFRQIHLVIKDDNSFHVVTFSRPNSDSKPTPNSDMSSCNLIKISLIYSNFLKDLLIKNLTNWQSCRFYMARALIYHVPVLRTWNLLLFKNKIYFVCALCKH